MNPNQNPQYGYFSGNAPIPGVGGALTNNGITQTGGSVAPIPANTTINSTTSQTATPFTVQPTTPYNQNSAFAAINANAPSQPVGTALDANGNAITSNAGTENRDSIGSLIDQLGGKAQATTDLQNQYGLDTKTQAATNSYNAYNKAKLESDQQIAALYNQPGISREGASAQASEVGRINNANLANLAVVANSDAGNLTAAQNIIKSKLDAQFQPIQDQIDARLKFLNANNADLTESEKMKLSAQIEQQKVDKTNVQSSAKDINDRLLQNQAPAAVYSAVDAIQQKYASGQISANDAINQMYQAVGQYGSTNKFISVNAYGKDGLPYQRIFDAVHGKYIDGQPGPTPTPTNSAPVGSSGTTNSSGDSTASPSAPAVGITNANGVTFAKYGNLAKTDFNPNNFGDSMAYNYLQAYLNNGVIPTPTKIGAKGPGSAMQFNNASTRALSLYFQATGQPMPTPAVVASNIKLISANNELGNKLATQEQTVKANVDLSLKNMSAAGLNSHSFAPLNALIDTAKALFNDPAASQLISQNATIQNELGSLLAVKNASGTTVYDKLQSAGIIKQGDTPEVIQRKVDTIIKEAGNFSEAINKVNGDLYKKIDPLMINPENPNRQAALSGTGQPTKTKSGKAFDYAGAIKAGYTDQQVQDYINNN